MKDKELVVASPFSFDVQKIMEQAIATGTGVEVMEKLLQMRNQMKAEAAKEAYNIALSEFQANCPRIIKGKDVIGNNNKKRYSYAPLDDIVEQVKGLLNKHGFSCSFDATFADNAQTITCTARHIGGHSETATFRAPVDKDAYMTEVQKHGAAMTFAKRYAFCQVFGIVTGDEDTDGRKPEQEGSRAQSYSAPRPTTPPQKPPTTGGKTTEPKQKLYNLLKANCHTSEDMQETLSQLTEWTDKENILHPGKRSFADISDKMADVARHKLEKMLDKPKKSTATEMGAEISKDMKEGYIAPKEGKLL